MSWVSVVCKVIFVSNPTSVLCCVVVGVVTIIYGWNLLLLSFLVVVLDDVAVDPDTLL